MNSEIALDIVNIYKDFDLSFDNFFFKKNSLKKISALKNITLQIKKSDRIGLIGRNGSGKSTLCKIISGITYPTSGIIKIKGKVSSVLEAGTGFEP